jgi:glycosyltransferase involved in cell wall biosynthesis
MSTLDGTHHDPSRPTGPREPVALDALDHAIEALVAEPRLTAALQRAEDVRIAAALAADPRHAADRLLALAHHGDDVSALAAIHALGSVDHESVDDQLLALLVEGDEPFAGHAAWAMAARRSTPAAIDALTRLAAGEGFSAMLAERTLAEWSRLGADPVLLLRSLDRSVTVADAFDPAADRTDLLHRSDRAGRPDRPVDGIVVIQPFLHARLDRDGTSLGSGDAGGIASLLRSLGSSLASVDGIGEVVTVTRRHEGEAASEELVPGHRVVRIPVGEPGPLPWRQAWVHRIEIERHLTALGRSLAGRRVVWHLRMADVGTLAAAAAARRLGQPVVFTAAPDPHIVIDALQDDGRLDRRSFAVDDAGAQYWFRARMVERLTAQADRLVVLPRPTIAHELVELLGLDPADLGRRVTVVPEGVDVGQVDRARARRWLHGTSAAVQRVLDGLPAERRALPWVLTVGRLHPTKGAQRIVDAVVAEPGLADRVNIVIVGGELGAPSPDEQSTIELVRLAARGADPALVTLTGNLPPSAVADLMVEVAEHGGVYVCAADKEEFGLAIVEAMAAGAVVVAPGRGGPRSYVDHGRDGLLCDTLSPSAVRASIVQALALASSGEPEQRAERAAGVRRKVRCDLSIDTMAASLAAVYRDLLPAPSPSPSPSRHAA